MQAMRKNEVDSLPISQINLGAIKTDLNPIINTLDMSIPQADKAGVSVDLASPISETNIEGNHLLSLVKDPTHI